MYLFLKSWQPRDKAISHVLTHAHIATITADTNLYGIPQHWPMETMNIQKVWPNYRSYLDDECAAELQLSVAYHTGLYL